MTPATRVTRRRLLMLAPAAATVALAAACGGPVPAQPAQKSAAEQSKPTLPPSGQAAPAASPAAAQTSPKPAGGSPAAAAKESGTVQNQGKQWSSPPAMQIDPNKTYVATIKTSLGDMKAELYAKDAPNTVNNFVFLAGQDFYDGVVFHRVINGFMVQTGDPTGTGRGGPGYRFNDELTNPRGYTKGTLAMANAGPNTQGSQFFICHGPGAETLPRQYTIFGKVDEGLDTLDKIASVPVGRSQSGENSKPTDPPRILDIVVEER